VNTLRTIDQEKWATLTIFEQMGNIYSEVGRSFAAKQRGSNDDLQAAKYRAIDLFDATTRALIDNKSAKTKEVLRAKEQYLAILDDIKSSTATITALDRYFMQFALAARLNR